MTGLFLAGVVAVLVAAFLVVECRLLLAQLRAWHADLVERSDARDLAKFHRDLRGTPREEDN